MNFVAWRPLGPWFARLLENRIFILSLIWVGFFLFSLDSNDSNSQLKKAKREAGMETLFKYGGSNPAFDGFQWLLRRSSWGWAHFAPLTRRNVGQLADWISSGSREFPAVWARPKKICCYFHPWTSKSSFFRRLKSWCRCRANWPKGNLFWRWSAQFPWCKSLCKSKAFFRNIKPVWLNN